jgi:hypothetical protein
MLVNSKGMKRVAEQIRERGEPQVNKDGVRLYSAQCETAARLLRAAGPTICNGRTEERPGWIEPEDQGDDPDVLAFSIGIFAALDYKIDKDGEVLA